MDLAKKLNAADEYLKLDRNPPEKQWEGFKEKHPYGFDVVVEATGSHAILEKTIDFCTRGGKLVYYGVYEKEAVVKYFRPRFLGTGLLLLGKFCIANTCVLWLTG
jgi:D-arabinitol dehydrogenase (NADP+)